MGIDPYELCFYRTLSQDIDPYGCDFIELCRRLQYSLPHLEKSDEYCLKQEPPLEARGGEPLAVVGI